MKRNLAVLFASAAILAACGGGKDEPVQVATAPAPAPAPAPAAAPATSPPLTINDTVAGFISYILTLIGQNTDVAEALNVSAVVPPLSDTTEPTTLP